MSLYDQSIFKKELYVFDSLSNTKILCEFFGTMAYVYITNWANVLHKELAEPYLNPLSIHSYAVACGMILTIIYYLGKDCSGAVYNPGLTVIFILFIISFYRLFFELKK